MSSLKCIVVNYISDLKKVTNKDAIVLVCSTNSLYAHYRDKWLYLAPYKEKPVEQKIKNCINCGAPITGHVCEYCGTRY